jgi:CheY-like chemotaxis protein
VLMDLQMPVMDGLEATRRLRGEERQELRIHQPIIGMSANSDHETAQQALDAGADAFMPKPFNADTIRTMIDRVKLNGAT